MAALYDWQLYDLDLVEDAIVSILRSASMGTIYGTRLAEARKTPSVQVVLKTSGIQGQRYLRFPTLQSSLVQPYNAWIYALECRIQTNRKKATLPPSAIGVNHRELVAKVRAQLSYPKLTNTFTPAVSPYHSITEIREGTCEDSFDDEENIDFTTLTFSGTLCIRDDAWPAEMS